MVRNRPGEHKCAHSLPLDCTICIIVAEGDVVVPLILSVCVPCVAPTPLSPPPPPGQPSLLHCFVMALYADILVYTHIVFASAYGFSVW